MERLTFKLDGHVAVLTLDDDENRLNPEFLDAVLGALDTIEADAIRFAISHYRGQMSEVARKLRIGRSTLYRKLDSLGLADS